MEKISKEKNKRHTLDLKNPWPTDSKRTDYEAQIKNFFSKNTTSN